MKVQAIAVNVNSELICGFPRGSLLSLLQTAGHHMMSKLVSEEIDEGSFL